MQNLPALPLPGGEWTRLDTARALQAGHTYVVQPSASLSAPTLSLYFGATPVDADSQAVTHAQFAWDGTPVWLKAASQARVAIIDMGASSADGGSGVSGVVRIASLISRTTAGTVAAGCTQVSCVNSGNVAATVAGASLPPGFSVTFDAPSGETLGAIDYNATGTTLLIATVT